MDGISTISTHSMACTISIIWIAFNTYGHFSNITWTNLWHLQEVSKNLWERVCSVYPNFNEHDCMTSYESMPQRIDVVLKSMGCRTNYWRFCRQLKQKWVFVYSSSFGFVTYFLIINLMWNLHTCAQICVVSEEKKKWIVCGCLLKVSMFKVCSILFVIVGNVYHLTFAKIHLYPMWKLHYGICKDEIGSPLW